MYPEVAMALTKRVEVLFDPAEYQQIERVAKTRGASVGALIRETLRRDCLMPDLERRQSALKRLLQTHYDFGDWATLKGEIGDALVEQVEKSLETP